MIVIFARQNTNQKVAVECVNTSVKAKIQQMLVDKYGGNWLAVEDLKWGTILEFEDENVYLGFEPDRKKPYTNKEKLY